MNLFEAIVEHLLPLERFLGEQSFLFILILIESHVAGEDDLCNQMVGTNS